MNTMELVHFASGARAAEPATRTSTPPFFSELIRPVRHAILRARQHLLGEQRSDGSWVAAQKTDASLASQLVLMLAYLGRDDSALADQAVATILQQQLPNGGWPLVPGAAADLSTSVQAYFALKLNGMEAGDDRLSRARDSIRKLGGADAADMPTRFFLALLGQVNYDCCPAIRPGLLWRREQDDGQMAALAVVWSHRPLRRVDAERGVRELFIQHPSDLRKTTDRIIARTGAASILTPCLRLFERFGWMPLRSHALNQLQSQVLNNVEAAQIERLSFCQLIWHVIAIHALCYEDASAPRVACEARLREMVEISDDSALAWPRVRSTPLAGTIVALQSLGASGMTGAHPSIAAAVKWLSERRHVGPAHSVTELAHLIELLSAEANREDFFDDALPPAIDLHRKGYNNDGNRQVNRRAQINKVTAAIVKRLLRRQNADGGWADFGQPSSPDVTGAVLESLRACGNATVASTAHRAVGFLRRAQRPDGSWESAHGVRLIHGTSRAVRGLLAAGVSRDDDSVAAGVNWLLVHQHANGGWGELPSPAVPASADDYVSGNATASQTAWALLALIAAGRANSSAARRGIDFLLETQQDDGQWQEPNFVLRDPQANRWFHSNVHAVVSPLLALSRWAVAASIDHSNGCDQVPLRLVGAATD